MPQQSVHMNGIDHHVNHTDSTQSQSQQSHCTHWQNSISVQKLKDRFQSIQFQQLLANNDSIDCIDCRTSYKRDKCWLCLHCSDITNIRCGRYDKQHAVQHNKHNPTHSLAVNLSHLGIYCYSCDDDLNDTDVQNSGLYIVRDAIPQSAGELSTDEIDPNSNNNIQHNHNNNINSTHSRSHSPQSADDGLSLPWIDYYQNVNGGRSGLSNLGNTCFMNSGLQSLLHCPPLIAFFSELDDSIQYNSHRLRLVYDFSLLIRKVWSGSYNVCAPRDILKDITILNPFFQGYGQHDTHEFIRCLLDNLHEAIKIVYEYDYMSPQYNGNIISVKRTQHTPNLSPRSRALSGYRGAGLQPNDHIPAAPLNDIDDIHHHNNTNKTKSDSTPEPQRKYENSIISDIFEGLVRSQVRCSNCHAISEVCDPFYDLSLEIPKEQQIKKAANERGTHILNGSSGKSSWFGTLTNMIGLTDTPVTLAQCLHSFSTSDDLTHADQYNCEKCKQKVDALKTLSIAKLPEVLCIHIKRFSHNSYFSSKINRFISFPLVNLDMSSYCTRPSTTDSHGNIVSDNTHMNTDKQNNTKQSKINGKKSKKDSGDSRSSSASDISTDDTTYIHDSTLYDLFGLVRHIGGTGGGHYIGYCKSHLDSQWYEFDDRTVKPITEDKVSKLEAYILFYRRHSNKSQVAQVDKSLRDAGAYRAQNSTSEPTVYISKNWLKKIQVLGRVEPIDNRDLCCRHGHTLELATDGGTQALAVPLSGWKQLIELYGGGPLATGIYQPCTPCELPGIRQKERDCIGAVDAEASKTASQYDPFYIVHTEWLNQWREFVQQDGKRPGPITNHLLVQSDGVTPIQNLQKSIDYRGLHGVVFRELLKIYGGGPVLVRGKLNIYDEELNPDLIKLSQKSTKQSDDIPMTQFKLQQSTQLNRSETDQSQTITFHSAENVDNQT